MSATGVVVIGASAGGLEAVRAVLGPLPPRFPAAVFVVFHHGARSASALPALLTRAGELPASVPHDGEAVENGSVYVARPDRHLIVEDGHVRLVFGPRRHGFRPAVDPLFISAARGWNSAAAGVILSGGLDDGSVGLAAIKHARGLALVQDPEEAAVESMPPAAVRDVEVDAVLCAADGDRTATRTRSLR